MHDLFELRRILECEAAALAAERHTEAHLAEMDAAIDAMAASSRRPATTRASSRPTCLPPRRRRRDRQRLVLHSMHAVRDVLRRALLTVYHIPHSPESAVGEHRAIRAAVAAGDAERAREEMRHHLARVESDVKKGVLNG